MYSHLKCWDRTVLILCSVHCADLALMHNSHTDAFYVLTSVNCHRVSAGLWHLNKLAVKLPRDFATWIKEGGEKKLKDKRVKQSNLCVRSFSLAGMSQVIWNFTFIFRFLLINSACQSESRVLHAARTHTHTHTHIHTHTHSNSRQPSANSAQQNAIQLAGCEWRASILACRLVSLKSSIRGTTIERVMCGHLARQWLAHYPTFGHIQTQLSANPSTASSASCPKPKL